MLSMYGKLHDNHLKPCRAEFLVAKCQQGLRNNPWLPLTIRRPTLPQTLCGQMTESKMTQHARTRLAPPRRGLSPTSPSAEHDAVSAYHV